MRYKETKSASPNSKLQLISTIKTKSKKNVEQTIKRSQKLQSEKGVSTLDNWLQNLYQSRSRKISADQPNNMETEENSIERNSKLIIRLEKLDLVQLQKKKSKDVMKDNKVKKTKVDRRKYLESLGYTDRSSEYTRLKTKEYKCAKCEFTHSHLVSVRAHFDKEHSDNILKCALCDFKTSQQYYFNSHMKFHSKPDLECPHCKKMIKPFSYKMHMKTHERNNDTEYKCDYCDYRSYNHANVKRHVLTKHKNPQDLKTFSCDSCDYVTILEERLKQHKKAVHSKEGVWLTCPQCEYTTRNKSHMSRHINDLHGEKNIQCTECLQLFSNKDNLRYHIHRKHTDNSQKKFYYCEMCPKDEQYKTTEKGNLARHILAHRTLDEIEVFACHKCSYLGKSKSALKTHLINAHMPEIHSFKCKICGYSTNTRSRFNHHVKDVHGEPKAEKYKRNAAAENNNKGETNAANDQEINEVTELADIKVDDWGQEFDVGAEKSQLKLMDEWAKPKQQG